MWGGGTRSSAAMLAALAPQSATLPHRPEHRETPAASCTPLGSGARIVSTQTSALIGLKLALAVANVLRSRHSLEAPGCPLSAMKRHRSCLFYHIPVLSRVGRS